jgi:hypothetical protein
MKYAVFWIHPSATLIRKGRVKAWVESGGNNSVQDPDHVFIMPPVGRCRTTRGGRTSRGQAPERDVTQCGGAACGATGHAGYFGAWGKKA